MMLARAVACALVVALAAPATLEAREKKPSRRAMKEARAHFQKGETLHEQGKFDQAIREYQKAYELARLPALLYNIGQVYRLKGDRVAAVTFYNRYLEAAPDGRGAPRARQFLEDLNRELEAEAEKLRRAGDDEVEGAVQGGAPIPVIIQPAPPPVVLAPPPVTLIEDRGGTLRTVGLVTGGAGVVVLGAGVFFGLQGRALKQDLDDLGPGDEYDPSVVDDGHIANRNALICFAVGGSALVTGGVLYALGTRKKVERTISLVPTAGGASFVVAGRF
jgi:tetratricopeptide (TPR) repeat protein